jgi:hypothetical protein
MKFDGNRRKEYKESIERLSGHLLSMQGKLKNFASDYEAANEKVLDEKNNAEKLCPRVTVTKYQKLNSEINASLITYNCFSKVNQSFTF